MIDLSLFNELSHELQEKASNFIKEICKFQTPFGKFYAHPSLKSNHLENLIQICFSGGRVTECSRLAVEALNDEEEIATLARYCVEAVITNAVLGDLKHADNILGENIT